MASIVFCVKRFSINGIENERYMVTIRNPLCFMFKQVATFVFKVMFNDFGWLRKKSTDRKI